MRVKPQVVEQERSESTESESDKVIESVNLITSDEDAPPSASSELDATLEKVVIGSQKRKKHKRVKVGTKIIQVKEEVDIGAEVFGSVLRPGASSSNAVAPAAAGLATDPIVAGDLAQPWQQEV